MVHVIEAENVTKRYERGGESRCVLREVSLSVGAGGFVSVMGPSGSGKSTLLNVLGAIDRSHDGSVVVDGTALGGCDDDELAMLRRRAFGFVFQAFNLVPVLSALENVALPGVIDGRPASWADARARELLAVFGLADLAQQRPAQLSGGEQQRVAIARALFLEPTAILADEPTGNLDTAGSAGVVDVLRRANQEFGQTIVMVTHDPEVAIVADEVLVLRDGVLGEPLRFDRSEVGESRGRRLHERLEEKLAYPAGGRRARPLVAG